MKACPKHCSLPLQLPEEHFASQGTRGGQRLGPIPLLRVRFLYYDQAVGSDALVEVERARQRPAIQQQAVSSFFSHFSQTGDAFGIMKIKAASTEEVEFAHAQLIENQKYVRLRQDAEKHEPAGFEESVLYPTDSRALHAVTPLECPAPRPSILFTPIEDRFTVAGVKFLKQYRLSPRTPAPGTEVIVKVQLSTGSGPWLYYDGSDESSDLNVQTFRGMIPADTAGLENARASIRQRGISQRTAQGNVAYKAFLRARAEGDRMRLFLDQVEDGFAVAEPVNGPNDVGSTNGTARATSGPWDLRDMIAQYFSYGVAGTGSVLEKIATTFDADFLDEGPRGRPSEGTLRFSLQDPTQRHGLIIDVDGVTRSQIGCPTLQGFWCYNTLDDPACTPQQLEFVMQDCGPGMAYGVASIECTSAEFRGMLTCLTNSCIHGETAKRRREQAATRDWGYAYPVRLSSQSANGFIPFEIAGKRSGPITCTGRRGPKCTNTDLPLNPNPMWRIEKAIKSERIRQIGFDGLMNSIDNFMQYSEYGEFEVHGRDSHLEGPHRRDTSAADKDALQRSQPRSKRMACGASRGLVASPAPAEVSPRKASSDPKPPAAKKRRVALDVDELDRLKCVACCEWRPPEHFSRSQLKKSDCQRRCIECVPTIQLPPQMLQLMKQLDGAGVIDRLRAAEGNEALLLGNERHPGLAVGVSCGLLPDVYRCVRFTATEFKMASQAGGVAAVVSVMRAHPTSSWVQIEGLIALESLIFSDHRKTEQVVQMLNENRKAAVARGVANAIESAVVAIVRDDPDDGSGRNCCEELTGASAEVRRCHLGRAPQLYALLTPKSNWAGLGFDLVATVGHVCAVRMIPAVVYDGSRKVTGSVVSRGCESQSAWEVGHNQVGSLRERMKAKKALAQQRKQSRMLANTASVSAQAKRELM